MPDPYVAPKAKIEDATTEAPWFTRGEKWLIALLFINGAMGGSQAVAIALEGHLPTNSVLGLSVLPVLGLVAAVTFFVSAAAAHILGILFYIPQAVAYFEPGWAWSLRSGLNFTFSVRQGAGVVILNVFAMVVAYCHVVAFLNRRARTKVKTEESQV